VVTKDLPSLCAGDVDCVSLLPSPSSGEVAPTPMNITKLMAHERRRPLHGGRVRGRAQSVGAKTNLKTPSECLTGTTQRRWVLSRRSRPVAVLAGGLVDVARMRPL
jgi:hypothetical protein